MTADVVKIAEAQILTWPCKYHSFTLFIFTDFTDHTKTAIVYMYTDISNFCNMLLTLQNPYEFAPMWPCKYSAFPEFFHFVALSAWTTKIC